MKSMEVKIRFNTNFGKSPNEKKWRLLAYGRQYFIDEINILCNCWTSEDIVKGDDDKDVIKFHISCNANKIDFIEDKDSKIKVYII